jgi:nucleotide-binding universal stress UspA family protein
VRVMVAFDGSPGAERARDLLANLALPEGSSVTLVTVLEPAIDAFGAQGFTDGSGAAEAYAVLIADLQQMLASAAAELPHQYRVDTRVIRGRPASSLLTEAEQMKPDLIVVGSRGHGPFASILLGSVSTELVDHAPCPVLVARRSTLERVVIGTDGSPSAQQAIDVMNRWPWLGSLPITVASVAPRVESWASAVSPALIAEWPQALGDMDREAQELARRSADTAVRMLVDGGHAATAEVRCGDAADQLIAVADSRGADLIVVGSRGLTAWSRLLLGSVARKVVLHARQSVLVVRDVRPAAASDVPTVGAATSGTPTAA